MDLIGKNAFVFLFITNTQYEDKARDDYMNETKLMVHFGLKCFMKVVNL